MFATSLTISADRLHHRAGIAATNSCLSVHFRKTQALVLPTRRDPIRCRRTRSRPRGCAPSSRRSSVFLEWLFDSDARTRGQLHAASMGDSRRRRAPCRPRRSCLARHREPCRVPAVPRPATSALSRSQLCVRAGPIVLRATGFRGFSREYSGEASRAAPSKTTGSNSSPANHRRTRQALSVALPFQPLPETLDKADPARRGGIRRGDPTRRENGTARRAESLVSAEDSRKPVTAAPSCVSLRGDPAETTPTGVPRRLRTLREQTRRGSRR